MLQWDQYLQNTRQTPQKGVDNRIKSWDDAIVTNGPHGRNNKGLSTNGK